MFKDTKGISLVLLCLAMFAGGCNGMAPGNAPSQSTSTPQPTPTPIGWRATLEAALLYEEVCAPPCWQGITPGISSEQDVISILEQLKAKGKIEGYGKSTKSDTYFVFSPIGYMNIEFKDGHVQYMRSLYPYANYRVRQVIDRFGMPEAVAPRSRAPEDNQSCSWWNDSFDKQPGQTSVLAYPSRGVTFAVRVVSHGFICPEMLTEGVYYYSPTSLPEALKEEGSPAFMRADLSNEDIVQWHGYGSGY